MGEESISTDTEAKAARLKSYAELRWSLVASSLSSGGEHLTWREADWQDRGERGIAIEQRLESGASRE